LDVAAGAVVVEAVAVFQVLDGVAGACLFGVSGFVQGGDEP
jgi:hypothetical protein